MPLGCGKGKKKSLGQRDRRDGRGARHGGDKLGDYLLCFVQQGRGVGFGGRGERNATLNPGSISAEVWCWECWMRVRDKCQSPMDKPKLRPLYSLQ